MVGATTAVPPRPPTGTMTLPATGRVVMRRAAKDPSSGLSAYLVKEETGGASCNISVAIKRKGRYIGTVLRGHRNSIVDMEFLPTPPDSPIFTLGTCDQDGVVFLWFLRLAKDNLGIDIALKQLRKYSFYSLRKNSRAYYNRIRLAGTPEKGTMVLVPNDGSNVRVICFSCEPSQDPQPLPALAAPEPVPQIEAPAPAPEMDTPSPADGGKAREVQMQTPTPLAQDDYDRNHARSAGAPPAAVAAGVAAGVGATAVGAAIVANGEKEEDAAADGGAGPDESDQAVDQLDGARDEPSPPREGPNATFPLSRRVESHGLEVDDDIAEAAARGAGLPERDTLTEEELLAEGVVEAVDEEVEDNVEDVYGEYEEEVAEGFSDDDDFVDAKAQRGVDNYVSAVAAKVERS